VPGRASRVELADGATIRTVRVALSYDCPGTGTLEVRSEVFRPADGVIDDATTIVAYDVDGHRGSALLDAGHTRLTVVARRSAPRPRTALAKIGEVATA
jgi:hypothetical protein